MQGDWDWLVKIHLQQNTTAMQLKWTTEKIFKAYLKEKLKIWYTIVIKSNAKKLLPKPELKASI